METNKYNIKELFQKSGEIIINKYENYNDIPEKFKFFYEIYEPKSCGMKRKRDNNNDDDDDDDEDNNNNDNDNKK